MLITKDSNTTGSMMDKKELTQGEKFRQAARDLDCEESEDDFDAKLRKIAKQKPKDPPDKKGGKRNSTAESR